ncbi:GGDEF domain-containing protein [Actinoplanes sp. NPDC049802]|uniref:GGDEF domain-containing protein n=1 Tax=Actinoplanes sp. NPDC049802 TaxID=3154742 RepID=UPI0033FBD82A
MSETENAGVSRPWSGGLAPVLVAVWAVLGVVAWLLVRGADEVFLGYLGGPVAMAAGVSACRRIARAGRLPGPIRVFWNRMEYGGIGLLAGAVAAAIWANNDTGIDLVIGVPLLAGVGLMIVAFLRLPGPTRNAAAWSQVVLDGCTVAVASALVFWYVVLAHAPAGTSLGTRVVAAVVGVVGVLLAVTVGKAAATPETVVDGAALRTLIAVPIASVVTPMVLVSGGDWSRMALSVLALPIVGVALSTGAYLQRRALDRPDGQTVSYPTRSVFSLLPFVAVAATAGLVVGVSAQDMSARQLTVIIGALLIAGCVVARQLLSLRENTLALRGIRRQQAELERLALSDNLTGLPNRARFTVALAERLGAHQPAAALLIDIDDFKMINDTLGPAAGDQMLFQVAQRLRAQCTAGEMPVRLGGDEFAVLLPFDDPAAAEAAAGRALQSLADPFTVGDQHLLVHASAGIAIAEPGETADEVLRNADIAMYAAKAGARWPARPRCSTPTLGSACSPPRS